MRSAHGDELLVRTSRPSDVLALISMRAPGVVVPMPKLPVVIAG